MTRKKRRLPQPGDRVTCKMEVEAYYSGFNGAPVVLFKPGMVGIVTCIAPKVSMVKGPEFDDLDDFLVVDFLDPSTGTTQRTSLNYCNAVVVDKEPDRG